MPSPRKPPKRAPRRPVLDEKDTCDCCPPDCDCGDCTRCSGDAVQVARDWIPPPAKGSAKAGKRR